MGRGIGRRMACKKIRHYICHRVADVFATGVD